MPVRGYSLLPSLHEAKHSSVDSPGVILTIARARPKREKALGGVYLALLAPWICGMFVCVVHSPREIAVVKPIPLKQAL